MFDTLPRRRLGALALACAATWACAAPAHAAFPEQPIKLVVGFPPGGGGDLYGRLIANAMGKTIGQTVIVENRARARAATSRPTPSPRPGPTATPSCWR